MTMSYIHYGPILIFVLFIYLLKAIAFGVVGLYFITKGTFKAIRWCWREVAWGVRSAHRRLVTRVP